MKSIFAVLIGISMFFSSAILAKRYLVSPKGPSFTSFAIFSLVDENEDLQLNDILDQVGVFVISTDSEESIKELMKRSDLDVEEEQFFPAPKPRLYTSINSGSYGRAVEMPWGIRDIGADKAWKAANFGEGARVLIIDTGIDREHPALKDNFEQGKDFYGATDGFNDINGHGTHVAGTVAGSGVNGLYGVAPRAKILSAKVCEDNCSSIGILSGVDWGIEQNVDVMNLSLGGLWYSSTAEKIYRKAYEANIVVVAAAGNNEKSTLSYPAKYSTVIAVGATDQGRRRAKFSQHGTGLDIMAPGVDILSSVPRGMGRSSEVKGIYGDGSIKELHSSVITGSAAIKSPIVAPLVFAGVGNPGDFVGLSLENSVALISRGKISFADKVKNAIKAGAIGVIIFNNVAGDLNATLGDLKVDIPVAALSMSEGLGLKKDLVGQGFTLSLSVAGSDYSKFAGTSMASPHIAGVAALLKSIDHQSTPLEVKEYMTFTATNIGNPFEYGSGLVNVEAAVARALE